MKIAGSCLQLTSLSKLFLQFHKWPLGAFTPLSLIHTHIPHFILHQSENEHFRDFHRAAGGDNERFPRTCRSRRRRCSHGAVRNTSVTVLGTRLASSSPVCV
ncbi:hypothetical protein MHYP_G00288400 [Metynnis hypsauchen]